MAMHIALPHELTHIQRRDDRWLLLTRTLVLSYWWMPWLIWMDRGYLRVMEESCDDAASEQIGHHLTYDSALVGTVANPVVIISRPADVFNTSTLTVVRNTRYSPAHRVPLHTTPAQTIRKVNRNLHSEYKPPAASQRMRRTFRFRLESR